MLERKVAPPGSNKSKSAIRKIVFFKPIDSIPMTYLPEAWDSPLVEYYQALDALKSQLSVLREDIEHEEQLHKGRLRDQAANSLEIMWGVYNSVDSLRYSAEYGIILNPHHAKKADDHRIVMKDIATLEKVTASLKATTHLLRDPSQQNLNNYRKLADKSLGSSSSFIRVLGGLMIGIGITLCLASLIAVIGAAYLVSAGSLSLFVGLAISRTSMLTVLTGVLTTQIGAFIVENKGMARQMEHVGESVNTALRRGPQRQEDFILNMQPIMF